MDSVLSNSIKTRTNNGKQSEINVKRKGTGKGGVIKAKALWSAM